MLAKDTLVITDDQARGAPRGARSKKADPVQLGLGSCIDCGPCVQVCPTGIDIRKGLQHECIGCAACIDLCDDVMKKMKHAPGLVRHDTRNGLAQLLTGPQRLRRIFRPRVIVHSAVLLLIVVALAASIALRAPFKVDIVRDRASLARQVEEGEVENVHRLQIMNSTEMTQTYRIQAEGLPGLRVQTAMSASTQGVSLIQVQNDQFDVGFGTPGPARRADEPPPLGEGSGPSPVQLLAAACATTASGPPALTPGQAP